MTDWLTTSAQVQMPRLIYGTAWKQDRTAELVEKSIRYGYRGIDTACQPKHYREDGVGAALAKLEGVGIARQSLFIQTKFTPLGGHAPLRIPYDRNADLATQVSQSFATSKKNLGTSYVDSFVLHSPYPRHDSLMTVWTAMEKVYESGGARQLGISNCYDLTVLKRLYSEAKVKPAVIQNRFYQETGYDREIRKWCQENQIVYQSFWTLTANPHLLNHKEVKNLAKFYQKTDAQIFFRFLTQIGLVPLTGTCSDQHMKEDLEIFSFELTTEQLNTLKKLIE